MDRQKSWCPQGSVLGPLLFLIYINDLMEIYHLTCLLADDSSLFTCVNGTIETHDKLLNDSQIMSQWAYQWKMVFNPDITKQAIEVVFTCKANKPNHPDLTFNNILIAREPSTKHLGVYLDARLNFSRHIKEKILKAMKGVTLLKLLSKYVERNVLDLFQDRFNKGLVGRNCMTNLVGSRCLTEDGFAV